MIGILVVVRVRVAKVGWLIEAWSYWNYRLAENAFNTSVVIIYTYHIVESPFVGNPIEENQVFGILAVENRFEGILVVGSLAVAGLAVEILVVEILVVGNSFGGIPVVVENQAAEILVENFVENLVEILVGILIVVHLSEVFGLVMLYSEHSHFVLLCSLLQWLKFGQLVMMIVHLNWTKYSEY